MSALKDIKKNTPHQTFVENLTHLFHTALTLDRPLAIWRKPQETEIHAICQISDFDHHISELEGAPEGFIFNRFQSNTDGEHNFIRSEIKLSQTNNGFEIHPNVQNLESETSRFFETYAAVQQNKDFRFTQYLQVAPTCDEDKESFVNLVKQCKQAIEEGYYQKIVPSRRSKFKYHEDFHPVTEVAKLCTAYENAFVSLVFMPGRGLWIGATPELLIATEGKQFRTVSLAGTQGVPHDFDLSQAAWRQKEIEEQALVSRYIINCFKQIRLREYDEQGPKTVKAGNLIHLKTSFVVDMEQTRFPELATTMLELLHPTSAICGMPMKPAALFLEQHEGYDREYFSGNLGPVNYDNKTAIFVNLRCAKLHKNGGLVFAGAGITEDSIPDLEWSETEIKYQTLLNVFAVRP
ncbi:hypothetical protein BFP72_08110 [Reichenbachiella sp. 5M10]|uniref:chorismate-binding protein n=1 Tax=Reichenbachiella sp. 5M10 TaxID=1889772 RepID=UPI000C159188|nr:chorismate-binding protein [Reichenbachiella sp. 5M10]PIB35360.1 hypothetical protein BFP72_08110 [Reichenbachiella sp. 5M10]